MRSHTSYTTNHLPAALLLPTLLLIGTWFVTPESPLRAVLLLASVVIVLAMLQQWLSHQRWFGALWARVAARGNRAADDRSDQAAVVGAARAAWLAIGIIACVAGGGAFVTLALQNPVTRETYDTAHLDNTPNLVEYRGFYSPERDATYGAYTWTQNRATLVFDFLVHRPITLTVEMRSAARAGGPDAPVDVYANGAKVGALRPDPTNAGFTLQQLRFVPPDWGGTQTEIKLIPAPFQPKGGDSRTLGTMVQHITVDRSEAWGSVTRWRWLLWLLSVIAILAGVLWLIGRSGKHPLWSTVGIIACSLVGGATAIVLLIVVIRVGAIDSTTYRVSFIATAYLALLFMSAAIVAVVTRLHRQFPGMIGAMRTGRTSTATVTLLPVAVTRSTRRVVARDLTLVFVAALTIRVIWAVLVPPWMSPDEPEHYLYVSHIAEQGRLPLKPYPNAPSYPPEFVQSTYTFLTQKLSVGFSAEDRTLPYYPVARDYGLMQEFELPAADRLTSIGGPRAASYPPLYYLLEAIPYRLVKDTPILTRIFAVRCGTAVLGALSCLFGYLLASEVRRRRDWGFALGFSMALMPMYVFDTTTINNDAMLNLATAAFLWLLVRIWLRGLSRPLALGLGLASGCVLLSKPTATLLIVVGAGIILAKALTEHRVASRGSATAVVAEEQPVRRLTRAMPFPTLSRQGLTIGLYALGTVALYGPWLLIRWFATGNFGLGLGTITLPLIRWFTSTSRVAAASPSASPPVAVLTHSFGEYLRFRFSQSGEHNEWLFIRTFWGYFGWLDVPMSDATYALIHVVLVIGLVGLALMLTMRREGRGVTVLLIALVLTQAVFLFAGADYLLVYRATGSELGVQGRYFFPVLAPFLLLCLMGWDWLCRERPIALRLAPLFMLTVQLMGLAAVITSYYGVKFG